MSNTFRGRPPVVGKHGSGSRVAPGLVFGAGAVSLAALVAVRASATPLSVGPYWMLVLLGFALTYALAFQELRAANEDARLFLSSAPLVLFTCVIGSRALYLARDAWRDGAPGTPWLELFREDRGVQSFAVVGTATAVVALLFVACRRPVGPALGALLRATPLGLAIGKLGCLVAGCCFGLPGASPFGVTWSASTPAFAHQVALGQLAPDAHESLPVLPLQAIEAVVWLLAFFWLRARAARGREASARFFVIYGCLQLLLGQLRGDGATGGGLGVQLAAVGPWSVTLSDAAALGFVVIGLVVEAAAALRRAIEGGSDARSRWVRAATLGLVLVAGGAFGLAGRVASGAPISPKDERVVDVPGTDRIPVHLGDKVTFSNAEKIEPQPVRTAHATYGCAHQLPCKAGEGCGAKEQCDVDHQPAVGDVPVLHATLFENVWPRFRFLGADNAPYEGASDSARPALERVLHAGDAFVAPESGTLEVVGLEYDESIDPAKQDKSATKQDQDAADGEAGKACSKYGEGFKPEGGATVTKLSIDPLKARIKITLTR